MSSEHTKLIYVGDPMCSWCWGFAPELDEVGRRTGLEIEVVVGGLRPGPAAQPLSERLASFLRREWASIAERTGQAFDPGILTDLGEEWLYDSELPSIAVVGMRGRLPERALEFFARIQRAFYAERVDVTAVSAYRDLVSGLVDDPEEFVKSLADPELKKETWQDFAQARRWGITGFPTLLIDREGHLGLVSAGYRPAEDLVAALSTPSG